MTTFREKAEQCAQESARQTADAKRVELQREFQREQKWWQDQVSRAFGKEWVEKIQWVADVSNYILLEGIWWRRFEWIGVFRWHYVLEAKPAYSNCSGVHLPWGDFYKVSEMSWAEAGRILRKPKDLCSICTWARGSAHA